MRICLPVNISTPDSYRECIYFKCKLSSGLLIVLMLFIANCVYTSVVRVLLCPNNIWMYLKSVPLANKCAANEERIHEHL
jgi:hypothetical protein